MSASAKSKRAPARRRRTPEAAAAEIIAAAEELLAEVPFRELSVDEVMARTTLSRSSFYVYFRDRYDLLLRVASQIGDEAQDMADRWLGGEGDQRINIFSALEGVVAVYDRHGRVLRAIADAAGSDPVVESVYEGLIERFVVIAAEQISAEMQSGLVSGIDPQETARALVWGGERYLVRTLGTNPPRESAQKAVETLSIVWERTIYQGAP